MCAVPTINNLNEAHVRKDHRRFILLMTTVLKNMSHKCCVVYIVDRIRVRHEHVKFHSRNVRGRIAVCRRLQFLDTYTKSCFFKAEGTSCPLRHFRTAVMTNSDGSRILVNKAETHNFFVSYRRYDQMTV